VGEHFLGLVLVPARVDLDRKLEVKGWAVSRWRRAVPAPTRVTFISRLASAAATSVAWSRPTAESTS
jgi:hypothetical protein